MNGVVTFTLAGPPVPLERARHGQGRTFTPAKSKGYQRALGLAFHVARGWPTWGREHRYSVDIAITFADRRRRDIDNVAKTVLDGLNGVAWDDDSQVDALHVVRTPHDPSRAGIRVTVTAIGAPTADAVAAPGRSQGVGGGATTPPAQQCGGSGGLTGSKKRTGKFSAERGVDDGRAR